MSDPQATPNMTVPPTVGWREALHELRLAWGPVALFSAKTSLAAMAALWIAFRIDLPSPGSAMITVFIVSQPVSGMVLEKSLYRLMGTLVGSVVTLVIVGLFAQNRVLFLLAIAVWIGLCTAGATRLRNFQSYAFVLAGYTAVLIGFSAALQPSHALQIAIDRVSVVSLGILCAGFVSDGLFPQHLTARLVALVRARSTSLYRTIEDALLQPPVADASTRRHAELIASVFSFESSRSAAVVEDPDTRARNARLQRLNAQFMAVTSTLHALERKRLRRAVAGSEAVDDALRPLARTLCEALKVDGAPPRMAVQAATAVPALRAARRGLHADISAARAALPPAQQPLFDDGAQLLLQLATELIGYTDTYAALRRVREVHARPGPRYRPSVDPMLALMNGLRAAAAMLLTSAFWIATAWPDAIFAIVNAAVFSAIFGSSPDPRQSIHGLLRGFGLGFVAALVCALWLLPQVSGFTLLAACLLPFLLPGFIWLTQPKNAGMGIGYLIMLAVCVDPTNPMHYDPAHLVNIGVAQMLGGGAALLSFTILVPDGWLRSRTRLLMRLRGGLAGVCREPLRGLRHRFESATRDLLQQQRQPPAPDRVDSVLATLELGHAIFNLRRALGASALPQAAQRAGNAALAALLLMLQAPGRDSHRRTVEALDRASTSISATATRAGDVPIDPAADAARRRLLQSLHRLREVVADESVVAGLALPPEVIRAA